MQENIPEKEAVEEFGGFLQHNRDVVHRIRQYVQSLPWETYVEDSFGDFCIRVFMQCKSLDIDVPIDVVRVLVQDTKNDYDKKLASTERQTVIPHPIDYVIRDSNDWRFTALPLTAKITPDYINVNPTDGNQCRHVWYASFLQRNVHSIPLGIPTKYLFHNENV